LKLNCSSDVSENEDAFESQVNLLNYFETVQHNRENQKSASAHLRSKVELEHYAMKAYGGVDV
jgi:hypothetical protein